jgi:5'(3')-deoxyribonucleotidase
MRIGIDCDGVLRDFIPDLINKIKETHPEHADKILVPNSWDWEQWLPFWTEEETEKYVFEDYYEELFGVNANPIKEAVEDWPKLVEWAKENGHELCLVSAQRDNCEELTEHWLQRWGFLGFDEIHFTHDKWSIDVDVLIDDSPEKLLKFNDRSVTHGNGICMKQTWNSELHDDMMSIDRLSDLMGRVFG